MSGSACGGGDSDGDRPNNSTAGTTAGTSVAGHGGSGAGTHAAGSGESGSGEAGVMAGIGAAGDGAAGFDAGSDPERNAVTPGKICERISTIQCAGERACCDNPGRDYDACKNDMFGGCMNMLYLDEIAMNQITGFDKDIAKTVFTQFETMASTCDPTVASWGTSDSGLRTMLKGTVAPGMGCTIKADATPQQAGAALASCTDLPTHACMFHSIGGSSISFPINWTCDPKMGDGGSCFSDVNCTNGLYCDNPSAKFSAKCKTRKKVGDACANPNECETLFCKKKVCVVADKQAAYCLKND